MTESTIKENIEVLVSDGDFYKMNINRWEFFNCELSDIENEIKNSEILKDIKNLLKLKYALSYEITNIEKAPYVLIIKTVATTELLKLLFRKLNFSNEFINSLLACLISFGFIYFLVFVFIGDYYQSKNYLFKKKRKKQIIQDLIDIEIEKRKKAPENNNNAEND